MQGGKHFAGKDNESLRRVNIEFSDFDN